MKTFSDLKSLRVEYPSIADSLFESVNDGSKNVEELNFMSELGGWVFVLETAEDLGQIVIDEHSLLKRPNGHFDVFAKDSPSGFWMVFCANNNAGGPTWFIPNSISVHPNVVESHRLTEMYWNSNATD